jgi:hypothetical protein
MNTMAQQRSLERLTNPVRVIRIDLALPPAMSGLLLTVVQAFETRKEAET